MAESNERKIPRRVSSALLNSLAAGVVPRGGLEYIAIGRVPEINALLQNLDDAADGGSAFRLVVGRYGSGKSFLLQLMRGHGLDRGFVTADADLSPERRLVGSRGQGLATYRELVGNLSVKAAPDGGALPQVLSRWITGLQLRVSREKGYAAGTPELAAATGEAILGETSKFEGLVHGFDFASVVTAYYRGVVGGDDEMKSNALRWLRGEYATRTEAKRDLPVTSIIDDDTWFDYLQLISALSVSAGYAGLLVFLDEAVNLYKITQSVSREQNYEKLLNIYNDAMQGRLRNMAFFVGGTPQFVEDTRRGLYSYEALRSRLAANRFAGEGRVDYTGPVLRLGVLSNEEIYALIKRVTAIHASRYEWEPPVSPDDLADFMRDVAGRMGADALLTPREVLRDYIGLLNVLMQNKDARFSDLIKTVELRPADAGDPDDPDGDGFRSVGTTAAPEGGDPERAPRRGAVGGTTSGGNVSPGDDDDFTLDF